MRKLIWANWDETTDEPAVLPLLFLPVWAGGWWDMNAAKLLDFQFQLVNSVDAKSRRANRQLTDAIKAEVDKAKEFPRILAPWNVLFAVAEGPIANSMKKFAQGQVQARRDADRVRLGAISSGPWAVSGDSECARAAVHRCGAAGCHERAAVSLPAEYREHVFALLRRLEWHG